MPVTEGELVCIARMSTPFTTIPERALWNPHIFTKFGNCTPWEFGLAEVAQDRGNLFVLVNPMHELHNLGEGGDLGSHQHK
jgi:hypothetical protein